MRCDRDARKDEIMSAMAAYRGMEGARFRLTNPGPAIKLRMMQDPDYARAVASAWDMVRHGIDAKLVQISRDKSQPKPLVTDHALMAEVCRQAFLLRIAHAKDNPPAAAAFTLERIGLTMGSEDFLIREGALDPEPAPSPGPDMF